MSDEDKKNLSSLTHLTPGDFRAVRNQYWLAKPEEVGHEQLIGALVAEQDTKLDGCERRIGFLNGVI
jgi:hypothetical protein